MDKKMFKSVLILITYTLLLTVIVVKFDVVSQWFSTFFSYIKPFIWGFVIAFILNKPIKFLKNLFEKIFKKFKNNKKISLALSVFITYMLFIGFVVLIISFILPQFSDSISLFINNIQSYSSNIEKLFNNIVSILNLQNFSLVDLNKIIQNNMQQLSNIASQLLTKLISMTAGFAVALLNIFISIIVSVYVSSSSDKLSRQTNTLLDAYVPNKINAKIKEIAHLTFNTFNNFVSGQLFEALVLGCMCFIGMSIFRFEYALLISVMIAVTSIIPVIGAFIGAVPSVFLLFMISPIKALWFIVFIIIVQQLENNFIYPKVVGNKVGLPAIWVLLAIVVGGGLFGVVGILLGVPVCSIIYTLLKEGAYKKQAEKNSVIK
ncbi:MAG: AI-2E family transporter [Eubacteriaceae bacterium]|nr:AI-2E family transporter [Eubacteriaceae bacterium]